MDRFIAYQEIGSMLQALASYGRTQEGGVTRYSFTPEDADARRLVIEWMEQCQMKVTIDAAGNIIGRVGPSEGPAIAIGSHIDSVPNGGIYDGPLGVTTALAVIKKLQELGTDFINPVEVIVFSDEEGARFGGGLFGSKAMTGVLEESALSRLDSNGISAAKALRDSGYSPEEIDKAKRESAEFKAYLEVHIEQAHVLEENKIGVGIVKAIAGPVHFLAKYQGRADHAGATPMGMRKDALLGACEAALAAEEIAQRAGETTVATVGRIEVSPGATNVISESALMSFDVRDINIANRDRAVTQIKHKLQSIAEERNLGLEITELSSVPPVELDAGLVKLCETMACDNNIPALTMISGAAHDAMNMTNLTSVVMLFVRSKDGLSHCPQEYSAPKDIEDAANLLYSVVEKLVKEN